jgi:hypothetical protein
MRRITALIVAQLVIMPLRRTADRHDGGDQAADRHAAEHIAPPVVTP